jgi:lipid-binding SYLF domain-containing protein
MTRSVHPVAVATLALGLVLALVPGPAGSDEGAAARVDLSRDAFRELMKTPDRGVPETLLKGCKGIAIFPHVVKGAFMVGARYGKGVVVCRDSAGRWSPPAFFTLVGGSVGWQIGAEATDVVLVFMTTRGTRSLLESHFTLGGSLSVAAGPIGRSAEASTDAKFNAEIYSYAKSKGAYAGISLEGAQIAADTKSDLAFYGSAVPTRTILFDHKVPRRPPQVGRLLGVLP